MNLDFPLDNNNRHFSDAYFFRKLSNGEISNRKWSVYSKHVDKHISKRIKQHENSAEHMTNMNTWNEMRIRLNKNETIDKILQEQIMKERWMQVLLRIFSTVKCLATHNLTFRGSNEKIYQYSNGNFLGLIEMIVGFDVTIQDYVRHIPNREIHYHYLGVKRSIIKIIKEAEYFSLILDYTPNIGHQEQMILIIRYVLKSHDLNVDDVRGQGYDNGSNMKGKHQGVQKRFLEINSRALYMPCSCHSLNLTFSDMALSCIRAISFFGIVQHIYSLFLGSTKRWKILLNNVPKLTRQIKSVKTIRFQTPQIRLALSELYESCDDAKSKSEAESSINVLGSFDFLLGMVIWYEILFAVNMQLEGVLSYFEKYRNEAFTSSMNIAKNVDLNDLFSKLKVLQFTLPNELMPATEILVFVKSADCYPNLKLIKTYLRLSMSEERLNGLAILSIEKDIFEKHRC
ncbi:hypothetical protein V6Z11_A05G295200 [Gossypium hirsutum]